MGLFTNRKQDDADNDVAGLEQAAGLLAQFNSSPTPDVQTDQVMVSDEPAEAVATGLLPVDAPLDINTFDPAAIQAPRRRLEDRPRAQAGNVEIDRDGLLNLLGVDADATLLDISEAHQRFVADHQPISTDDDDAAQIKKRIRHEANSAYASFRLTHSN